MTAEEFRQMTGRKPEQDDLERANCAHAGELGHLSCGICPDHQRPMWECVSCGHSRRMRIIMERSYVNDSRRRNLERLR